MSPTSNPIILVRDQVTVVIDSGHPGYHIRECANVVCFPPWSEDDRMIP